MWGGGGEGEEAGRKERKGKEGGREGKKRDGGKGGRGREERNSLTYFSDSEHFNLNLCESNDVVVCPGGEDGGRLAPQKLTAVHQLLLQTL